MRRDFCKDSFTEAVSLPGFLLRQLNDCDFGDEMSKFVKKHDSLPKLNSESWYLSHSSKLRANHVTSELVTVHDFRPMYGLMM